MKAPLTYAWEKEILDKDPRGERFLQELPPYSLPSKDLQKNRHTYSEEPDDSKDSRNLEYSRTLIIASSAELGEIDRVVKGQTSAYSGTDLDELKSVLQKEKITTLKDVRLCCVPRNFWREFYGTSNYIDAPFSQEPVERILTTGHMCIPQDHASPEDISVQGYLEIFEKRFGIPVIELPSL